MKWRQLQRNLVGICRCRNEIQAQVLYSKERRIPATTGRHSATLLSKQQCKIWTLQCNTGETKARHWTHTSISHTQIHNIIPSPAYTTYSNELLPPLFGLPSVRFPKKLIIKISHVGLSEPYVYPAGFSFLVSNWTKLFKRLVILRKFKSILKLDSRYKRCVERGRIFVYSLRHEKKKQHFAWALVITFPNNWAPHFNRLILLACRPNPSPVLSTQSSVYTCSSMKNRRRPWQVLTQNESQCSILSNQFFLSGDLQFDFFVK
jgi:hypothetical protein